MVLELVRVSVADEGAFGVLVKDEYPFAVTLEHTYEDNRIKIPSNGIYLCKRTRYYKGGYETFGVDVHGHSRILFHKGNVEDDADGCILVGKKFGRLNGRSAILESAVGFKEFMVALHNVDEFMLKVRT